MSPTPRVRKSAVHPRGAGGRAGPARAPGQTGRRLASTRRLAPAAALVAGLGLVAGLQVWSEARQSPGGGVVLSARSAPEAPSADLERALSRAAAPSAWGVASAADRSERASAAPGSVARDSDALQAWADRDPAGAARWAVAQGVAGHDALAQVHDRWLHRDPRAALASAHALPPGPLREQLLGDAASRWLAQDEQGAQDWLLHQTPEPAWDAALARHALDPMRREHAPALVQALAARISDAALRAQVLAALAAPPAD